MNQHSPSWKSFCDNCWVNEALGFRLDLSRMGLSKAYKAQMEYAFGQAFDEMKSLERGEIANFDEQRRVGHYWLRAEQLSPSIEIRTSIESCLREIKMFVNDLHSGDILAPCGEKFRQFVLIGIGGSALGPQFVNDALGEASDKMKGYFLDNTDPDGFDRVFRLIEEKLDQTLVLVVSKSGGTKETRNGMLELEHVYRTKGLDFGAHCVAITQEGSLLYENAMRMKMLKIFPMWDWVGGRTSLFSAVGMLPAALQGIDIDEMRRGAAAMDECTRVDRLSDNPAALLAMSWYHAGRGRGMRAMVMLPYKDRLVLLSRYLQQLVMESLGKELDRTGKFVHQGIVVYGNKGSTDQHAYVQQLREGDDTFFVNFVQVLEDRKGPSLEVEDGVTSGDYLLGFFYGTRQALWQKGHPSLTVTLRDISPFRLGLLIALYERAVGLYASLIDVNAYHQPGVEAGKKAAGDFIKIQHEVMGMMQRDPEKSWTIEEIGKRMGQDDQLESLYYICDHLVANGRMEADEAHPFKKRYKMCREK